jgi:hypothetical protein
MMNDFLPRISTPAIEGPFQAAKWIKIQALVDQAELEILLQEPFFIYPLSGAFPLSAFPVAKKKYLENYSESIEALKMGGIPNETKDLNVVAWANSPESVWLQQIPGDRYMVKPCEPFVQVQIHQMGFSEVDREFRPMILSQASIFWGLQFSFPKIYQEPKTLAIKESEESELFQVIRQWVRNYTLPTPMMVHGKRVNIPMRLGKNCFSWINKHPQLLNKNLSVMELIREP